jgi:RimJ/RimL family protein N-acetyltransferase
MRDPSSRADDVLIRCYRREDVLPLFEAAAESVSEIHPWLPWCHPGYAREESEAWVQRCGSAWREGTEYEFAIVQRSGRFLGGCGLNQIKGDHHVANLGYWVRSSETRHGIATAAVRKLVDFAFRETDLLRLEIVAAVENIASQRVAERADALREGVLHDRLFFHGRSHDAVLYAFVRSHHLKDR